MAKYTPGRLGRNIPPVSKYPILYAGRNTHIAQVVTRGVTPEEAEANADRLVQCWNSHDEMKEALRNAEATLGENIVWIADQADLTVRQKDPETLRRLAQLDTGWKALVMILAKLDA